MYDVTNTQVWEKLFQTYPEFREGSILDPSCNDGAMLTYLIKHYKLKDVFGFDLDRRNLAVWAQNPTLQPIFQRRMWTANFLTYNFNKKYNNIITEPMPLLAVPYITKSLNLLYPGGHVAFLLRMDWVSKQNQTQWLRKQPLYKIIQLTKSPKINESSSTLDGWAFYVFKKDYTGQPDFQWLRNSHDVQIQTRKPFRFRLGKTRNS